MAVDQGQGSVNAHTTKINLYCSVTTVIGGGVDGRSPGHGRHLLDQAADIGDACGEDILPLENRNRTRAIDISACDA